MKKNKKFEKQLKKWNNGLTKNRNRDDMLNFLADITQLKVSQQR